MERIDPRTLPRLNPGATPTTVVQTGARSRETLDGLEAGEPVTVTRAHIRRWLPSHAENLPPWPRWLRRQRVRKYCSNYPSDGSTGTTPVACTPVCAPSERPRSASPALREHAIPAHQGPYAIPTQTTRSATQHVPVVTVGLSARCLSCCDAE